MGVLNLMWKEEWQVRWADTNLSSMPLLGMIEIKTPSEAEFVCRELKRQELLRTYVLTQSR
jgi:hypothetical protein